MMKSFQAIVISKSDDKQRAELSTLSEEDLMDGDVTVAIEYSAFNYKDGLAISGAAPIIRRFPLIPGIDFSGSVIESTNGRFTKGDKVILNGFGVGEVHHGGFSQIGRVKGDWLVALPGGMSTRHAMGIGTAGYTAMLSVLGLEDHGLRPADGDVLVTGAAGGVGSVAIMLLAKRGYRVVAATGRVSETEYLRNLGASEVLDRQEFSDPARPLGKERWAGAVDVAGGNTLANVLSQMKYGGMVAACGLADSMKLPTSVAPFILRGVTLKGIDSVMADLKTRTRAWDRLAQDLDRETLDSICTEVSLQEVLGLGESIIAGKIRGRTIVNPVA
jgi:acrylyl-CoA reductase (NADPH)